MLTHVVVLLLAQSPAVIPTEQLPAAERAALAAERAAAAAERAAAAAEKIAQAAAPSAPEVPAEEKKSDEAWKGLVSAGLIYMAGNADALTGTAAIALDKKWGGWGFGVRANGAYGQSSIGPDAPPQVSALRGSLIARGDRQVISLASIFLLGGVETDHVKSVELRGLGEIGVGIKFLDRKDAAGDYEKIYLRADIAFRYAYETRFQYFASAGIPAGTGLPPSTLVAPRLAATFRYGLNKGIRFSEEFEVLPNVLGESRVLINNNTKLSARVTEMLSVNASFLLTYDSAPAGGKKPLDATLGLGLEAAF